MVELALILLSVGIVGIFGYRQFNQWTEDETRADNSDSDLLAFAAPRSFTSLGRFVSIACLYCLSLIALYFLLYLGFRYSKEMGTAEFLKLGGVTPESAWLAALFVVTGLSSILPVFSNVERSLRKVMHAWAVVPTKAHQLAHQITAPSTELQMDRTFLQRTVLPKLLPRVSLQEATADDAATIAQKWCRLHYLLARFAPPESEGLNAPALRKSPYIVRFRTDLEALQKDLEAAGAADDASLRQPANSPAMALLAERVDSMLHRLYVLMSCRAFGTTRSLEGVSEHFARNYGLKMARIEITSFPTGPVLDTLAAVTLVVFGISLLFVTFRMDVKWQVDPLLWAVSTFAVHGSGVLIGWTVFARRKGRWRANGGHYLPVPARLSREHMVAAATLAFGVAMVPITAASIFYLHSIWAHLGHNWEPQSLPIEALKLGLPWSLLGSATAVAAYWHLERSANQEGSRRLAVVSALSQAGANLTIAIAILLLYSPVISALPSATAAQKFADPVTQLVLILTAAIGATLGLCLPRTVRGHGLDQRGGAKRYRPQAESRAAQLSLRGRRLRCEIEEISRSGGVLRGLDVDVQVAGRAVQLGQLTLADRTSLPVRVTRELPQAGDGAGAATRRVAVEFTSEPGYRYLPKGLRAQLERFLAAPEFQAAAAAGDD
jgi:hypothetical protein